MALQILNEFRPLMWHIPPPPTTAPAFLATTATGSVYDVIRNAALNAWPTAGKTTPTGPLIRYLGALTRDNQKKEYAYVLHALAYRYDQDVHIPLVEPITSQVMEQLGVQTTVVFRAAQLVFSAYAAASLPEPWSSDMHMLLETHARLWTMTETTNPGPWSLSVAAVFRHLARQPGATIHVQLYAQVADVYWRTSALTKVLVPPLFTVDEEITYSSHHVAEQYTLRLRYFMAAETVVQDALRLFKQFNASFPSDVGVKMLSTQFLTFAKSIETRCRLAENQRETYAVSRGDYDLPDITTITPLEFPATDAPNASWLPALSDKIVFQLDSIILREIDAFRTMTPTSSPVDILTPPSPGEFSVNSVVADALDMKESDLLKSGIVKTTIERRTVLLGTLNTVRRAYNSGILGVRDPAILHALDTAIGVLLDAQ